MDVRTDVVQGEIIEVGDREFVPVVRRVTGVRRTAVIGTTTHSAWGGGFAHLRPVGLIERRENEELFISIPDRTRQLLAGFATAAVAVPLLLGLGTWLARRNRE
jgi:hypothetical protein